tara:strand:+ start:390 stop:635 length:246 start_codon:yes stop_codon:yes gene_type:complete
MAHTLYVGNLPFKISDEELAAHFASAGEVVEVTHVRDRGSDRSNGCGFIEMADATGAEQAVVSLDGSELAGRTLTVGLARP